MNENKVIVLEQKPIISYGLVEQKGKEVGELISSLKLGEIEASESNLKLIKDTRSSLSKEFKIFEDQRKMVKELIMKPYNDFDEAYKQHIKILFEDADKQLKEKTTSVESALLDEKINGIKEYFNEVNKFDFIKFDDLNLKIIRSKSDNVIKSEIDNYITAVDVAIETINTLENSDRVLAKFQISKDLNSAISQTNIEIQREKEIFERKEAQRIAEEQRKENQILADEQRKNEEQNIVHQEEDVCVDQPAYQPEPKQEDQQEIFKASFTVFGTKEQFAELKQFMKNKGIRYE
jgi:hypothetical protein